MPTPISNAGFGLRLTSPVTSSIMPVRFLSSRYLPALSTVSATAFEALQHAAQAVGQKAEDATASVGSSMQKVADTVRDQGPNAGILGTATHTVADAIEGTGKYLEDKNLHGMMEDVTGLIKRNPIPAVLLGLGIGFLVGRALSSRNWS